MDNPEKLATQTHRHGTQDEEKNKKTQHNMHSIGRCYTQANTNNINIY